MFMDTENCALAQALEKGFDVIETEFNALEKQNKTNFAKWHEPIYEGDWSLIGILWQGQPVAPFHDYFQETVSILKPFDVRNAAFSRLGVGAYIKPHVGYTDEVLRCHLCIRPSAGARLRVEDETREWTKGKCLYFDDTYTHEAWNDGPEERIVLIVDVIKEEGNKRTRLQTGRI